MRCCRCRLWNFKSAPVIIVWWSYSKKARSTYNQECGRPMLMVLSKLLETRIHDMWIVVEFVVRYWQLQAFRTWGIKWRACQLGVSIVSDLDQIHFNFFLWCGKVVEVWFNIQQQQPVKKWSTLIKKSTKNHQSCPPHQCLPPPQMLLLLQQHTRSMVLQRCAAVMSRTIAIVARARQLLDSAVCTVVVCILEQ